MKLLDFQAATIVDPNNVFTASDLTVAGKVTGDYDTFVGRPDGFNECWRADWAITDLEPAATSGSLRIFLQAKWGSWPTTGENSGAMFSIGVRNAISGVGVVGWPNTGGQRAWQIDPTAVVNFNTRAGTDSLLLEFAPRQTTNDLATLTKVDGVQEIALTGPTLSGAPTHIFVAIGYGNAGSLEAGGGGGPYTGGEFSYRIFPVTGWAP